MFCEGGADIAAGMEQADDAVKKGCVYILLGGGGDNPMPISRHHEGINSNLLTHFMIQGA